MGGLRNPDTWRMNAVGRLGSYISGPFHPFGGAVDIIVVEQQDGSIKSSNWYVRFGKFQGVLKTKEKVVSICVNGEEANFHMYLDHKGEAFFLREVDVEEGESVLYPSSGDETDVKPDDNRRPKSCNFVVEDLKPVDQIDVSNENIMRRTNSRRSRIFGLVFGRRSVNQINYKGEYDNGTVGRNNSLERAEFAANLLEVNWSTTLGTNKLKKDNASQFTAPNILDGKAHEDVQIHAEKSGVISSVHDDQETSSCSYNGPVADSSQSGLEGYVEETTLDLSCLSPPEKNVESTTLLDSLPEIKSEVMSEVSGYANESIVLATKEDENVDRVLSGISYADSQLMELQTCSGRNFYEKRVFNYTDVMLPGSGISQKECETDRLETYIYYESSESSMVGKDASGGQTHETLYIASDECGDVHVGAELLNGRTELLSEVS